MRKRLTSKVDGTLTLKDKKKKNRALRDSF